MVSNLDQLLVEASTLLGCSEVSIRCWCPILEAVYAERDGERLVITDRGETCEYLSRRDNTTYLGPLEADAARDICRRHGVEFKDSDPELFPRIQRTLDPSDDVAGVVASVGEAIDAINRAAMRPELRY